MIGSDSLGSSISKEQLSDRLDRKEIVRGTALTITGGFLWGLAGKSTGAGMDLSMARSDCGGSRSRDYFADESIYGAEEWNLPYLEK